VGRHILARVKHAKLISLLGCLCLVSAICTAQTTPRSLLLVSGVETEIGTFTHAELRKMFLGVPVIRDQVRLRPLLNSTDPLATSIFLQQVVFMSEREYRRQLLSRVFRLGDQPPPEYEDIDLLVEDLRSTRGSLTFMWSDQFAAYAGLKSLAVLWTSSNN